MDTLIIKAVFVAVYLPVWICGAVNQILMKKYFRNKYPEIAREVFPSALDKSIKSDIRGTGYIFRRRYTEVSDPSFVSRMDVHRNISIISMSVIALGILGGILFFALQK